jgi:hypothetical protein
VLKIPPRERQPVVHVPQALPSLVSPRPPAITTAGESTAALPQPPLGPAPATPSETRTNLPERSPSGDSAGTAAKLFEPYRRSPLTPRGTETATPQSDPRAVGGKRLTQLPPRGESGPR